MTDFEDAVKHLSSNPDHRYAYEDFLDNASIEERNQLTTGGLTLVGIAVMKYAKPSTISNLISTRYILPTEADLEAAETCLSLERAGRRRTERTERFQTTSTCVSMIEAALNSAKKLVIKTNDELQLQAKKKAPRLSSLFAGKAKSIKASGFKGFLGEKTINLAESFAKAVARFTYDPTYESIGEEMAKLRAMRDIAVTRLDASPVPASTPAAEPEPVQS